MCRRQSILLLPHHQLGTVLQCLRQMHGLNLITPRQIRDGTRQFQYSVISTRGQLQLTHAQHYVAARIKL